MKNFIRRIACLAVFTFGFIINADALPCAPNNLSGYIGLGSAGCTIGHVLFSDFNSLDVLSGATQLDPSDIDISPLNVLSNPGFNFVLNMNAGLGESKEILIGYIVSGGVFTGNTLSMTGSTVSGDGAVTVIEDKCLEGDFGPDGVTGCNGIPRNQIVFDIGIEADLFQKMSFGPVSRINVVNDIVADGGVGGASSLLSVTNQFNAVPEPSTLALILFGFSGIIFCCRRQHN